MKIKYFVRLLFLIVLGLVFTIPSNLVHGETISEVDEIEEPYINFYDANNNLIESYEGNEVDQFKTENIIQSRAMLIYYYAATNFSSNIYINSGNTFYNLGSVVIDPLYTIKSLRISLYSSAGVRSGYIDMGNILKDSAVAIPVSHLGAKGNYRKIQLSNLAPSTPIYLKKGSVFYNL